MKFTPTALPEAYTVELEPHADERGFFARAWCRTEFRNAGLADVVAQVNLSFSRRRGTFRGLHYQAEPHGEAKLVRVIRGAVFDVIVDVRPDSPRYLQWVGVELSAASRVMLYVPTGFAHGYLTLEDDTELLYQVSTPFAPAAERGLRFDDPRLRIELPAAVDVISAKDLAWPFLENFEA